MCTEIMCTIHNNYYCKTPVDDYFIFNSLMGGNVSALAVSQYNDAIYSVGCA